MKLTSKDVEHVAWLARLELAEDEIERITGELNQIMVYFEKLQQLNTDAIEPTSHSLPITNVFREDEPQKSLDVSDAVSNAPNEINNYFIVPQIVEI